MSQMIKMIPAFPHVFVSSRNVPSSHKHRMLLLYIAWVGLLRESTFQKVNINCHKGGVSRGFGQHLSIGINHQGTSTKQVRIDAIG